MDFTESVNQRVREFIIKLIKEEKVKNQTALAKVVDLSREYISQVKNKKTDPSDKLINALIANFPDAKSFIYGTEPKPGEMASNARIWPEIKNQMAIHLVHERAHAGFATMWSDREWLEDLPTVFMDERKDGKYVAFEVVGDSMECESSDSIKEGDIIIAKELQQHHWTNKLHVPGIFVIVINGEDRSGVIIKEVTRHDTGTGTLTCHSYNSYNPDEEIKISEVVKIYYAWEHRKRMRRR